MTMSEQMKKVLVILEDPEARDILTAVLTDSRQFEYLMPEEKANDTLALIRENMPDILILAYAEGVNEQIDLLITKYPQMVVVVFMAAADAIYATDVMLAGARAFVLMPTTEEVVLNTLIRVGELHARLAKLIVVEKGDAELEGNHSVVVFSPRGGSGCSTLAVNLAIGLKQAEQNKPVLLIDGKLMFGDVDLMLNMKTQNSIADLLPYASSLDEILIKNVISEHVSEVDVLVGPPSVSMAQGVNPDDLYTLLLALQTMYPLIVVDGGSKLDDNTVTMMDASFRILLVFGPDLASLRDIQRFLELAKTLNYPSNKIMLVLNDAKVKGGVHINEIENVLQTKITAIIPHDSPTVLRSLNKGFPLLLDNPKAAASKAIKDLVEELLDQIKSAKEEQAGFDNAQQNVLRDSSRLG